MDEHGEIDMEMTSYLRSHYTGPASNLLPRTLTAGTLIQGNTADALAWGAQLSCRHTLPHANPATHPRPIGQLRPMQLGLA